MTLEAGAPDAAGFALATALRHALGFTLGTGVGGALGGLFARATALGGSQKCFGIPNQNHGGTMRIIGFAAFALAALGASAWAQEEPRPDCGNPVTQMDMNICAGEDFAEADEALNAVYGDVMAAMRGTDAELKEMNPDLVGATDALKKAQRAWITYRDAHCELAGFDARGGSMEPMLVSGCMAELTRARTKELQALLGEEAQ